MSERVCCTKYVKELGRICDKPAVSRVGFRDRCEEHHPYLFMKDGVVMDHDPWRRQESRQGNGTVIVY